ncbi:MAG: hypothetical protein NTW08_04855 [Gammaproteobacteria bacterium]|nr:hypothetical protein [Gammaproteobacteria bacterium]
MQKALFIKHGWSRSVLEIQIETGFPAEESRSEAAKLDLYASSRTKIYMIRGQQRVTIFIWTLMVNKFMMLTPYPQTVALMMGGGVGGIKS